MTIPSESNLSDFHQVSWFSWCDENSCKKVLSQSFTSISMFTLVSAIVVIIVIACSQYDMGENHGDSFIRPLKMW